MSTTTKDGARQARFDIFVTALEGGIGYWSSCEVYRWRKPDADPNGPMDEISDLEGYYAEVYDVERTAEEQEDRTFQVGLGRSDRTGEEYARFRIDDEVIRVGVQRFIRGPHQALDSYWGRARMNLERGRYDDLDIDASIADHIVQLGLFGEAIYG